MITAKRVNLIEIRPEFLRMASLMEAATRDHERYCRECTEAGEPWRGGNPWNCIETMALVEDGAQAALKECWDAAFSIKCHFPENNVMGANMPLIAAATKLALVAAGLAERAGHALSGTDEYCLPEDGNGFIDNNDWRDKP